MRKPQSNARTRMGKGADQQTALLFDERSTQEQQYAHTAVINAGRAELG
ncbi:MAG: hypothetical protein ABL900_14360 [Burkholderiaceae bacterium]